MHKRGKVSDLSFHGRRALMHLMLGMTAFQFKNTLENDKPEYAVK
jgi:hypothetical protein